MILGDTIAAISSVVGAGARIIVRVSGPDALRIAGEMGGGGGSGGAAWRTRLAIGGLQAPAWVYQFNTPRSYTGEDLVEFHLPGNPLLARMALEEAICFGARPAEPGEFTARAYFNGRMDLTAAEGVAAAIGAHGDAELAAARQLMAGELARRLQPMMEMLAQTLALVETGIDFSEEDVTFLDAGEVVGRAAALSDELRQLVARSARFERLAHEPQLVLVGRPNAGKSTLLNALAGMERAVVSPVAGTTRDVLGAEVALPRGIVRMTDAAGLEEMEGEGDSPAMQIHRQMRQRALAAVAAADLLLLARDITDARGQIALDRPADLVILSKADLVDAPPEDEDNRIPVSAATGWNLDRLRSRLDELAFGRSGGGALLALNARHLAAIADAMGALDRIMKMPRASGAEFLALELREALDALGRIVGQVTPDDLLGRVFAAFCIGK